MWKKSKPPEESCRKKEYIPCKKCFCYDSEVAYIDAVIMREAMSELIKRTK